MQVKTLLIGLQRTEWLQTPQRTIGRIDMNTCISVRLLNVPFTLKFANSSSCDVNFPIG